MLFVLFSFLFFADEGAPARSGAGLPPALAARLGEAVHELQRGRIVSVHKILQPLLENGSDEELTVADAALAANGIQQTVKQLVLDARLQATLLGQSKQLKAPGAVEAPLALKMLSDRFALLLKPIDDELAIGFRVNAAHEVYDELLQRLPNLLDQMEPAEALLTGLADVAKAIKTNDRKRLDPDVQKIAARNVAKERNELKERSAKLGDRIVETSLARIPDMLTVVADERADYKKRHQASARLEESFALLKANWKKYRNHKAGGEKTGMKEVEWKGAEATYLKEAGQLRLKVYHFEQAKQWWLRGRFGKGALNGGFAKAVPQGVNQQESLLYGALLMPDPIPKPADPLKNPRPDPTPRRHLEVWKVGAPSRPLESDPAARATLARSRWKLQQGVAGVPAAVILKGMDWMEPAVFAVGYIEYQLSLYHFAQLRALVSNAEWKALDEMVGDDDRFLIHSYLSRKYNGVEPNSTLRLSPAKNDDPRAKDVYERRGLIWATAFARVELGAMRALYSGMEREPKPMVIENGTTAGADSTLFNTTRGIPPVLVNGPFNESYRTEGGAVFPFLSVRPYHYWAPPEAERVEFAEILWDGAREHYYQLQTATQFTSKVASSIEDLRAALRRLSVGMEMAIGYRDRYRSTLNASQLTELAQWIRVYEVRLGQVQVALATQKGTMLIGGLFFGAFTPGGGLPVTAGATPGSGAKGSTPPPAVKVPQVPPVRRGANDPKQPAPPRTN